MYAEAVLSTILLSFQAILIYQKIHFRLFKRPSKKPILVRVARGPQVATPLFFPSPDGRYLALLTSQGENYNDNLNGDSLRLLAINGQGKAVQAATWIGLLENHAHPAVKMASIKQSIRLARAECEAALSPEQFASAWEAGKTLNLDTVVAELLNELKEN